MASRSGSQITHTFGLPGWWEATLNGHQVDGHQVARYNDLDDLVDRLEASFG